MAINFNNQNQGIGTLDLSQFGLMQPQNTNMQVAEAFNYGTLPQATKSFTPKSTMTTGAVVDGFMKENPNANRGDFMKALQDGSLGSSASQLFNKNVDSLFEGVNLDKNYFGNVTPTYQGTTDGTFRGNIDIDKGSLNEKALESLPEGFFKSIGAQSSLGLPANDRYASLDSFFSPTTMNDATNTNAPAANDLSGLDLNRFAGVSNLGRNDMDVEQVEQLGSPSRFQGFKNKVGNFMDNPVTRGLGTAVNFARGSVPGMIMSGVGSLFNRDPKSPSYQQYSPQSYLKDNNLKNIYNANPSMINDFYDDNPDSDTFNTTRFDRAVPGSFGSFRTLSGYLNRDKVASKAAREQHNRAKQAAKAQEISLAAAKAQQAAIGRENASYSNQGGGANQAGSGYSSGSGYNQGNYCFDPSTPIQMADGSTKKIKNIQLGDNTKGGEVTGVFQFKATDEIHDYKGVTVAGSHYVKEDGRFIMVKDSPLSVKIDKIPVVYSLDTSGRRIFINDIEFADYNGDGVAKNFLSNAGADLTGFDKEVLRQVEQRLI